MLHDLIDVDLVIPIYNEEAVLMTFHQNLRSVLDKLPYHFWLYYVNDGSRDHTQEYLEQLAASDPRVKPINLSKNFGHQAALTAGLERTRTRLWYAWMVMGSILRSSFLKWSTFTSRDMTWFWQKELISKKHLSKKFLPPFSIGWSNLLGDTRITPGTADFRLMSRQVVDALKQMPEYHRFLRGMVAWIGYKSIILPFTPSARIAGETKYTFKKMLSLALDAIFSFSLVPLQIGLAAGLFFFFLAFLEVIYVLSLWIGETAPVWLLAGAH